MVHPYNKFDVCHVVSITASVGFELSTIDHLVEPLQCMVKAMKAKQKMACRFVALHVAPSLAKNVS
jgi:hypothetical protein